MEFKFGLMVQNIKVIGRIIEHMAKDAFSMQTAIDLKVISLTINLMAAVFILARTAQYILACGLMMFSMGRVQHSGLMDLHSRVGIRTVRRMELVVIHGLEVINTKASGRTI